MRKNDFCIGLLNMETGTCGRIVCLPHDKSIALLYEKQGVTVNSRITMSAKVFGGAVIITDGVRLAVSRSAGKGVFINGAYKHSALRKPQLWKKHSF